MANPSSAGEVRASGSQGSGPNALSREFPRELVAALDGHFNRGPFRITARDLGVEAHTDEETAARVLQERVDKGLLTTEERYICPCDQREVFTAEQASQDTCTRCGRAFEADLHARPEAQTVFVREAPQTRDVRWVLALHGMNTVGAWQEAFNWLISRIFKRSVPVAIYKYGVVRPGAVLKFRQRVLIRGLDSRIRRLSGETEKSGFSGVPDVIAHSFGTWLLGHSLQANPDLRVGRVILTGCILRPDFDWSSLIPSQVEAVLCHTATKDGWARTAHYIIPDSGPSGLLGFNNRSSVAHAVLHGGHHRDFFGDNTMPGLFENVWRPFLTAASGSPLLSGDGQLGPSWKQVLWPLRATVLRIGLLVAVLAAIMAAVAAFSLGAADLWRLVFG